MLEDFVPRRKFGVLSPLSVIENGPYEFYRLAPPGVVMVLVPCGLREFSAEDVARIFEPLDQILDSLMARQVDIVVNAGVPLSLLMGPDAHDRFLAHIEDYTGKPASSTVTALTNAARHLGLKRIAVANKWNPEMNAALEAVLARDGIALSGVAGEVMDPDQFQGIDSADHLELAYALGRQALEQFPDADGLYIGGGTWLAQPVCEALEDAYGKPCLSNQACAVWDGLRRIDYWRPKAGHGKLMAGD
jgi:maleate cis-trans isomerase